jgi:hypothetical protein
MWCVGFWRFSDCRWLLFSDLIFRSRPACSSCLRMATSRGEDPKEIGEHRLADNRRTTLTFAYITACSYSLQALVSTKSKRALAAAQLAHSKQTTERITEIEARIREKYHWPPYHLRWFFCSAIRRKDLSAVDDPPIENRTLDPWRSLIFILITRVYGFQF